MMRMFNIREGFGRKDDTLPGRLFEPLENGALKGQAIDRNEFENALSCYYQMSGWDEKTGIPTPAKLAELDLDWISDHL
jgi:aldehyde:ferredoxin oxidoreductase